MGFKPPQATIKPTLYSLTEKLQIFAALHIFAGAVFFNGTFDIEDAILLFHTNELNIFSIVKLIVPQTERRVFAPMQTCWPVAQRHRTPMRRFPTRPLPAAPTRGGVSTCLPVCEKQDTRGVGVATCGALGLCLLGMWLSVILADGGCGL